MNDTALTLKLEFSVTLAIDFDGTLCSNRSPDIGDPILPAFETLKKLQAEHKVRLILWTCRQGIFLEKAVMFCHEQGLFFDAVNTNVKPSEFFGHPKILADFYIDDRTVGWHDLDDETRWQKIHDTVVERCKFNVKNAIREITP